LNQPHRQTAEVAEVEVAAALFQVRRNFNFST
jgi:hypothetical protein